MPGDGYANFSGTSMAAPARRRHRRADVVGRAVRCSATSTRTRALLDDTAIDTDDLSCGGTADDNNVFGEGRLDALAAVDAAPRGDTGTLDRHGDRRRHRRPDRRRDRHA